MSFEILKIKISFDEEKYFPMVDVFYAEADFRKRVQGYYKLTSVILSKQDFEFSSSVLTGYMKGKKLKKDAICVDSWSGTKIMVFANDYQEVGTATLNFKEDKEEIKIREDQKRKQEEKEKTKKPTLTIVK